MYKFHSFIEAENYFNQFNTGHLGLSHENGKINKRKIYVNDFNNTKDKHNLTCLRFKNYLHIFLLIFQNLIDLFSCANGQIMLPNVLFDFSISFLSYFYYLAFPFSSFPSFVLTLYPIQNPILDNHVIYVFPKNFFAVVVKRELGEK